MASFKSLPDPGVKTVMVAVMIEKKESAIRITYGDGQSETRPLGVEFSAFNPNKFYTELQAPLNKVLNEFKEKGYSFAGNCQVGGASYVVLEKD